MQSKEKYQRKEKKSQTEYQLVQKGLNYSLVRLKLRTGRTHQIRVHLASLGYPLLGDQLYGGQTSDLNRQALHASQISFDHPLTQQKVKVRARLPQDLVLICQNEQIKHRRNFLRCFYLVLNDAMI